MDPNSGSLAYWHSRWREDADPYAASWPDRYARLLELEFLAANLGTPASVLEIGCGPFTVGESPNLYKRLSATRYTGLEGASAAVDEFLDFAPPSAVVLHRDLEDPSLVLPAADLIISRRVLQNLTADSRRRHLQQILNYPHGILIEGSTRGLAELNAVRAQHDLPHLLEPAFNSYLNEAEEDLLLSVAHRRPFMSTYYKETRGTRQLIGWNTRAHFEAYYTTLHANEGSLGPNMGFAW